MSFREVKAEELTMNPFTKIGKEWLLITAGNEEKCNTMTASWGAMGVMWGKNAVTVYIRPQRYTKEFVEREDQKILFVPAFEQLMGYVKKLYPTQRINYQDSSESSKVCMTFSFLKGFQAVLESLLNEIGVFVLNFEMNIDEYKILINIEAKPKVIKNAKDFYEKRSVLENKLTKEFSIERWKTNAVVIQTMIEM